MSSRFDTLASELGVSFVERSILSVCNSELLESDYSKAYDRLPAQRKIVVEFLDRCGLSIPSEAARG